LSESSASTMHVAPGVCRHSMSARPPPVTSRPQRPVWGFKPVTAVMTFSDTPIQ
jgi:hypothetical protein